MLGEDPIVVSPQGIPETTIFQRDPEWAWQTAIAADQRPDEQRLIDLHPPPFLKGTTAVVARSVADRHYWQSQKAMPRSWNWWTNFTAIEFRAKPDGTPGAIRQSVFGYNPQSTGPDMKAYLVADVPLDVTEILPEKPTP
jgi:hypothetical protein